MISWHDGAASEADTPEPEAEADKKKKEVGVLEYSEKEYQRIVQDYRRNGNFLGELGLLEFVARSCAQ